MHEYDTALKLLLQRASGLIARELGIHVKRWLNIELPKVQNPRVDLLAETTDGRFVHIEIQSTNDGQMALRMLEYGLLIFRHYGRFPIQIVLYVGDAPMHMASKMELPALSYAYSIVNVRDLDGERLLASTEIGDNIIAILARLRDQKQAVRNVVKRIAELPSGEREEAFRALLIIAGLRRMATLVKQEAMQVPVLNDIMDHEVIGPAIRQGLEQGRQEGRQEEALSVLRRVIEKRFGPVPGWVEERLKIQSVAQLEELAVRAIDAPNLEDLFHGEKTNCE